MNEYFQVIRNRVGPRTPVGEARTKLEKVVALLREGGESDSPQGRRRLAVRVVLEAEWRPGSVLEFVLVDQLVETMLRLSGIGPVHDAAMRMAMEKAGDVSEAEAMAAALATPDSGPAAVQRYERGLVRQQRQLMRDLRELQQQRVLADEEAEWTPTPDGDSASEVSLKGRTTTPVSVADRQQGKRGTNPMGGRVASDELRVANGEKVEMRQTNPILSQAVAATAVVENFVGGVTWPKTVTPMRLPNGEMFDEWNRPDRK